MDIFSVRNTRDKRHKVVNICGIKIKFRRKTKKKTLKYEPYGLIVDTTLLCNNNCSFCWRKNFPDYLKELNSKYKNKTMPFDIFKKIIDDACQYDHITWFTCCGPMGDPMLNSEIEKFYEYAHSKKHFKWISVNTNGYVLDKKDLSILLNSINEFSISVDSINIDTYEKIHGHRDLDKVINNIKKCVEYKKKNGALAAIVVRFTENELNRGQIDEFAEFFKEIGVDEVHYAQEHSFAGVKEEYNDEETMRECPHPHGLINFDFLGNLTTCCINWHLVPIFGNIKNKTIKQMWESRQKFKWNDKTRFNTKPCNNCSGAGEKIKGEVRSRRIKFH